jgi:hypothetical protein
MTDIHYTRCDQCGKTTPRDNREGWLYISRVGEAHRRNLTDAIIRGTGYGGTITDLCSWDCAHGYITVQLLDPAPEAP